MKHCFLGNKDLEVIRPNFFLVHLPCSMLLTVARGIVQVFNPMPGSNLNNNVKKGKFSATSDK